MARVLCVGSAAIDHVLEVDELPRGEGKTPAREFFSRAGGNAATAAVAVTSLGGEATWCGVIGDDDAGTLLRRRLDEAGVAYSPDVICPGARTLQAVVAVDRNGGRWLAWHGGTAAPAGDAPALPDFAHVGAVVADELWEPVSVRALELARAYGVPGVLDVEMPTVDSRLVRLASHLVFSADGLSALTGIGDIETALAAAGRLLPDAVVGVTLGAQGSAWATPSGVRRVPAPRVVPRDTTGCGDTFHGAYALALAEGAAVEQAGVFATAAAALKARNGNGWPGMPDRRETDALVTVGWE